MMMHSFFFLQKNMWEFRQLPACHLCSWRYGFQCITSCTPMERLLSLDRRRENNCCQQGAEIQQKALKCSGKRLREREGRRATSALPKVVGQPKSPLSLGGKSSPVLQVRPFYSHQMEMDNFLPSVKGNRYYLSLQNLHTGYF